MHWARSAVYWIGLPVRRFRLWRLKRKAWRLYCDAIFWLSAGGGGLRLRTYINPRPVARFCRVWAKVQHLDPNAPENPFKDLQ